MIQPKNETEDLLLSITKNSETLVKQIQTKPQQTLEFRPTKPRETFHFNPPISIEVSWMIGLISLEVYNSIFNINYQNNFDFYADTFDEFPFAELEVEVEEIVKISNFSNEHLQDE